MVSDTHTSHMNIYHLYAAIVCVSQDVLFRYLMLTLVTRICTSFMLHSFVSLLRCPCHVLYCSHWLHDLTPELVRLVKTRLVQQVYLGCGERKRVKDKSLKE